MAKTLYMHVGMPKCASTTIQQVLKAHKAVFAEAGKFYGCPPGDRTHGQGNVTTLIADIRANRKAKADLSLKYFLERDSDVILSSEMLIGFARNVHADNLVKRARAAGFDVQLICYVRRQDQWIESDYKQHIKGGSDWQGTLEALIDRRRQTRVLDYAWLLDTWARSLGHEAITVVPLRNGQSDAYALERFLDWLGMDPSQAENLSLARQNVSPPVAVTEPMRYYKIALLEKGIKPSDTSRHLQRFQAAVCAQAHLPERRFLLDRARRERLLAEYSRSNAKLSKHYLSGTPAFDDTVEGEDSDLAPLAEEAGQILAEFIAAHAAENGFFERAAWPVPDDEPTKAEEPVSEKPVDPANRPFGWLRRR